MSTGAEKPRHSGRGAVTTYEALNRFGDVVRTFNTADLAEAYRDRMAALNTVVTLRKRGARTIWREQRRAAA